MEIEVLEKTRKRHFAYLCVIFILPVLVGFTIVDFIEGDMLETILNILMTIVSIAGFIGLQRCNIDKIIYPLALGLLSIVFLYIVSIGSGEGTAIFWMFPFPLVFVFFLGLRVGAAASAAFFIGLCILMLNPFDFDIHPYDISLSLRFLVSLLMVIMIAWGLESVRERYARFLVINQESLMKEKTNLEKALGEIKTLTGLIPICSHCKKVRNDEGYWQQVESYVRDHSNAEFSHGICPDCVKKVYPDYENMKKETV